MRYNSGAAFRRALEDRLRASSLSSGVPLVRLRKTVVFDRFLSRLFADQPDDWILKGGFALELRLGHRARTTKDIDLLLTFVSDPALIHQVLVRAALLDLKDWFQFQVTQLSQQIAEKVHAYTRSYATHESTRVKDWVDILLMAEMGRIDGQKLRQALRATFDARGTHPLPTHMPEPASAWSNTFRHLARQVSLGHRTLAEAHAAMSRFLDPVLGGQAAGVWDPAAWGWR